MHNVPLKVPVDGQAQRLGPAKKLLPAKNPRWQWTVGIVVWKRDGPGGVILLTCQSVIAEMITEFIGGHHENFAGRLAGFGFHLP
jgi:hypothetical protein